MTTDSRAAAFPYASALAFEAALTVRLNAIAVRSGYTTTQLRRQFAYDRLLARLFVERPEEWILKGGVSMIARLEVARHTADVDIVATDKPVDGAVADLHHAAGRDLGDFFAFRFDAPRSLVQGVAGVRLATEAWLGNRRFERFGVDLVSGVVITGGPDEAEPLLPLNIPGLCRPNYRLYPLVDSIADKVMAIMESYKGRPSTRFRDLVDLVLIAGSQPVRADELAAALASERLRRGIPQAPGFAVPDLKTWTLGYRRAASDLPGLVPRDLNEALAMVKAFADPVLTGSVVGHVWNPSAQRWQR
jgi:hypothetical protein